MPPVISGKYGSVEFADCRASLKEMVKKGILYDFSLNRNFIYVEIVPENAIIAKKRVAPYINKIDQWVQK
jgi:hypothetical protein